jgi:predicted acylesterase/phospholipase RssA
VQHLIQDLNISFDIVCGTSTGALMAPLIVADAIDDLVHLYTSLHTNDVVLRREVLSILKSDSVYNVQPLMDRVSDAITNARAASVLNSPRQMFLATVCLQTGRPTYFYSGPPAEPPTGSDLVRLEDRDSLILAMMGSADMPALMPPIQVFPGSRPVRQYVDGGVRERAPLEVALANGATEIYAVILAPKEHSPVEKKFTDVEGILLRTIGAFTEDVLLHDLLVVESVVQGRRYFQEVKGRIQSRFELTDEDIARLFSDDTHTRNALIGPSVDLIVIRPDAELAIDTLTFDPGLMARLVETGRERAVLAMANRREWLA